MIVSSNMSSSSSSSSTSSSRDNLPILAFDSLALIHDDTNLTSSRPQAPRRSTDPSADSSGSDKTAEPQHRDRSPQPSSLFRTHTRSRSALSPHDTVPMIRTRSLPSERILSPSYTPTRSYSPMRNTPSTSRQSPRRSIDEAYPPAFGDFEIIAEDSAIEFAPRPLSAMSSAPFDRHSSSLSRSGSRRRPPSPLHQLPVVSSPGVQNSSPMGSIRFNEPFPGQGYTSSANSSLPTTPTSYRSRSPSISSLEIIPDLAEADEEQAEKEAMAVLQAKMERAAVEEEKRLGSRSKQDKRKRWSVCGAETRGTFEMETIWED